MIFGNDKITFDQMMDQDLKNSDLSANNVSLKANVAVTKSDKEKMLNKCNQCEFASFYASALKKHMKKHSGEMSNKCN